MNLRRKSKGLLSHLRHNLKVHRHHAKKHLHRRFEPSSASFRDINVAQWGF